MRNSQELAIFIKKLAKEKKIPIKKMLDDCSLSINTLSSMQAGGFYPRLENIIKIADYLGVTIDYLLNDVKEASNRDDTKLIIDQLSEEDFEHFLQLVKIALPEQFDNKKDGPQK